MRRGRYSGCCKVLWRDCKPVVRKKDYSNAYDGGSVANVAHCFRDNVEHVLGVEK